jgi:hypothetical protein
MQALGSFYGLQACWFRPDRLFKIYVSTDVLAGAYVAGQLYDGAAAQHSRQALPYFSR